jgi:hypothetical protein
MSVAVERPRAGAPSFSVLQREVDERLASRHQGVRLHCRAAVRAGVEIHDINV